MVNPCLEWPCGKFPVLNDYEEIDLVLKVTVVRVKISCGFLCIWEARRIGMQEGEGLTSGGSLLLVGLAPLSHLWVVFLDDSVTVCGNVYSCAFGYSYWLYKATSFRWLPLEVLLEWLCLCAVPKRLVLVSDSFCCIVWKTISSRRLVISRWGIVVLLHFRKTM